MSAGLPDRRLEGAAGIRVGDAEREAAVAALGEHYVAGRLDQDEFDARTTAAYAARYHGEVDALFADLPSPRPGARVPAPRPARRPHAPIFLLLVVLGIALSVTYGFPPVLPLLLVLWFVARVRRACR